MSQRVAAPVDKKPAPVPSVPVRGALPSYVPCNHARATHARLARAARYLEANATVTFSVLVRYGESGRSVTLRVPCLEGVTTAGDVLDVARARCPRGAAADALCTADGPGPPCVLPAAAVVNTLLCSGANVTAAPAGTVPVVVQPRRWRVCGASIPRGGEVSSEAPDDDVLIVGDPGPMDPSPSPPGPMDPAAPPSPPGRAQYDTDRDASGDGGGSGGVGRTAAWAGHAASDGDAMPSPAPAPPPPAAAGATLAEELLRIAAALAQNTSITHAQWRALEEMVAASDENLLSAVSVYFSLRPSDVPGGSPRASFKSHHSEAACAADLAYLARVYAMAGSDGWHGPGARGPSPAADDVDTAPRRGSRRGAGSGDADDSDGSTSSDGSCPSDVAPPIVGKRLSVRQPRRPVVVAARYGRAPEAADARTGPDAGAALGAAAPTVAPTAVPAAASCDRRVGEPTGAGAPMLDPGGVLNFVGHGAAVGRQHRGSIIPVPTVTPRHLTNEAVRLSGAAPVAATATGVPPRPAPASRVRAVSAAMGSRRSTPWTPTGAAAAARVARPPSATALRPRGEGGASGSGAGSAVAAAPAVAASASAAVAAAVAALEQRVAAVAAASAVALASTAGPASRGGASGRRSVVEAAQAGAAPQSAPRSEGARAPAAESADPGSARRGFASPRALGARSASGDSADGGGNGGGGDGGGGISRSESAASEQFILLVQPSARRSTPWRLNLKPSSLAAKGPVPRTPGRPQMPTSGRRSARPARLAADA